MEKRILEILDFFINEEIIHEALTVTFDDYEGNGFDVPTVNINIDYSQLVGDDGFSDMLTCGNDETLYNEFEIDEITFFHELGHYCDLHYRFNFDTLNMIEEIEKLNDIMDKVAGTRIEYMDSEIGKEVERYAQILYRNLFVEKAADENARYLMKYYLERTKEEEDGR